MNKLYGMKTCTTNPEYYLPTTYHEVTHSTIAEMLANEDYPDDINSIQISTCHRIASLCFDTREILLKFINIEHLLHDIPITCEPDHHGKMYISIESLPIELPDKEVKTFLLEYTTPVVYSDLK